MSYEAWVLVGATGTGKSGLAQELAERLGYAVLAADSMSVYRDMDIGTAKMPLAERGGVDYYGIDLVDPDQPFSTGKWLKAAYAAAEASEEQPLIVVGGTGLYIKALMGGLEGGAAISEVRAHWQEVLRRAGKRALQEELGKRVPEAYAALADKDNIYRLTRALEHLDTYGALPVNWKEPLAIMRHPIPVLSYGRAELHVRIGRRIDEMFRVGLLEEVAQMRRRWPEWSSTARKAIGYAEAAQVLDGELSVEEAKERMAARTRQLAKRQETWFRHQCNAVWIEVGLGESTAQVAERVLEVWRQHGSIMITPAGKEESKTVKDIPIEMQPREQFERLGVRHLANEVLLAIILRSGSRGVTVVELARRLLERFNGLKGLSEASFDELCSLKLKGMGRVKSMELVAALELGRRAMQGSGVAAGAGMAMNSPEAVYTYMRKVLQGAKQESFWVLLLNTKKRLIGQPLEVTRGLLNSTPVHPREMFAEALKCRAHSVTLVHNHPSGDPTPSPEDLATTRRLIDAARILGIEVNDHVVIGSPGASYAGYVSLRALNLVNFDVFGKQ